MAEEGQQPLRVPEGFFADRQHVAHVERYADVRAVQFLAQPAHVAGRGVGVVLHRDDDPVLLRQRQRLAQNVPARFEMGVPPARQRTPVAAEHAAHDDPQRRGPEAGGRGDETLEHLPLHLAAVGDDEQSASLRADARLFQRGRRQVAQAVVRGKLHAGQSVLDGHVHEFEGVMTGIE